MIINASKILFRRLIDPSICSRNTLLLPLSLQMIVSVAGEAVVGQDTRAKELKEFDETKARVKGLVDSGLVKIPRIFIHPTQNPQKEDSSSSKIDLYVPVIDFDGLKSSEERRAEIVEQIREASEKWGFFQMINHGVPTGVMDNLLDGAKRFHEQPREAKMGLYSRYLEQRVRFYSNGDQYESPVASWRDTLTCSFPDGVVDLQSLPIVCRDIIYIHTSISNKAVFFLSFPSFQPCTPLSFSPSSFLF